MNKENKTKLIKITFIILMVFISVFSIISTSSYAVGGIGPGIDGGNAENVEKIKTVTAKVIGIIQWIGLAISVVMLIAIGIQFFTVSTNPDEKAKAKIAAALLLLYSAKEDGEGDYDSSENRSMNYYEILARYRASERKMIIQNNTDFSTGDKISEEVGSSDWNKLYNHGSMDFMDSADETVYVPH